MRHLLLFLFILTNFNLYSQRVKTYLNPDTTIIVIKKNQELVDKSKVKSIQNGDTTFYVISEKREIRKNDFSLKLDSFINYWVGKPYVFGGTTSKGIDCSGFTQKLFNHIFDINIPRTAYEQYKKAIKIPFTDIKTGDLIFFISRLSPSGWHVAYYLGNGRIFHAANRKVGVVIQHLTKDMEKNIYAVGRFLNN